MHARVELAGREEAAGTNAGVHEPGAASVWEGGYACGGVRVSDTSMRRHGNSFHHVSLRDSIVGGSDWEGAVVGTWLERKHSSRRSNAGQEQRSSVLQAPQKIQPQVGVL